MTRSLVHLMCTACLLTLLMVGVAAADAVKLSGFWIEGVTVRSVGDGVLVYATSTGGEVAKPLTQVEGIRLQLYPQIEQAMAATEAGDHAKAVDLLQQVKQTSQQPWVDLYATRLLVEASASAARPLEAARYFVEVAQAEADPFFVPEPPTAAVTAASDGVKRRIADLVRPAAQRARGERQAALQQLLDAATDAQPAAPEPQAPAGDAGATTPAPAVESAVTLPQDILKNIADDPVIAPIVSLLQKGQFDEALAAAKTAGESTGRLSDKLYLLGMAQLSLAEQSGDEKRYKDAGLSFMRVVIYFPRSGVAGPALLEAGYVHEKIGRADLAQKLYDRARLVIDPETEPAYHQRFLDLTQ